MHRLPRIDDCSRRPDLAYITDCPEDFSSTRKWEPVVKMNREQNWADLMDSPADRTRPVRGTLQRSSARRGIYAEISHKQSSTPLRHWDLAQCAWPLELHSHRRHLRLTKIPRPPPPAKPLRMPRPLRQPRFRPGAYTRQLGSAAIRPSVHLHLLSGCYAREPSALRRW